jgi:hypothetical protein
MSRKLTKLLILAVLITFNYHALSQVPRPSAVQPIVRLISKTPKKLPKPYRMPLKPVYKLPKTAGHWPSSSKNTDFPGDLKELKISEPLRIYLDIDIPSSSFFFDESITYEHRRIYQAQQFLDEVNYFISRASGDWDFMTEYAFNVYHLGNEEDVRKQIELFMEISKYDVLNKNTNMVNVKKEYVNSQLKKVEKEVIITQRNLNRLGYYSDEIDGIFGPNSQIAMLSFKNDYHLERTNFKFLPMQSEDVIKVQFEKGKDFIKYWKTNSNTEKQECEPALCFQEDKITIVLKCNDVSVKFSTNGEILINLKNENHTYTRKFNSPSDDEQKNEDCELKHKVCISNKPDYVFSVCGMIFKASSSGSFTISSKDGPITRTVPIW